MGTGLSIAQMVFRSSLHCLVGGGPSPRFPPNKVMIWEDEQARPVGEIIQKTQIRAVRIRKDRIAVATEMKTLVYDFSDLRLIFEADTGEV
jgi:WD repeat-containing protein 45